MARSGAVRLELRGAIAQITDESLGRRDQKRRSMDTAMVSDR
jgi:hypothetical protein